MPMYKGKSVIGIITARGGSRMPGKNIRPLNGKPLIAYTIDAAKKSTLLTRCIVSTDNEEIAATARKHGAEVPFMRPAELAKEDTSSVATVQHALTWLSENEHATFDYVMILQPTSPLRTAEDIDACIKKIVESDADSVMSMVEIVDFAPEKLKVIKDDVISPYLKDEGKESARRDAGLAVYKRNAAIYLTKTTCMMSGDLFGTTSRPYIMPHVRSVDVNGADDFAYAEFLLTSQHLA